MADKKIAVCVLEGKVKGTIRFEQTVCLPPTVARSHPYMYVSLLFCRETGRQLSLVR